MWLPCLSYWICWSRRLWWLSISGLMRENVFKKSEVQYIIKPNFLCVIKVTSFVNFFRTLKTTKVWEKMCNDISYAKFGSSIICSFHLWHPFLFHIHIQFFLSFYTSLFLDSLLIRNTWWQSQLSIVFALVSANFLF
jgi:hypothetical protein